MWPDKKKVSTCSLRIKPQCGVGAVHCLRCSNPTKGDAQFVNGKPFARAGWSEVTPIPYSTVRTAQRAACAQAEIREMHCANMKRRSRDLWRISCSDKDVGDASMRRGVGMVIRLRLSRANIPEDPQAAAPVIWELAFDVAERWRSSHTCCTVPDSEIKTRLALDFRLTSRSRSRRAQVA